MVVQEANIHTSYPNVKKNLKQSNKMYRNNKYFYIRIV